MLQHKPKISLTIYCLIILNSAYQYSIVPYMPSLQLPHPNIIQDSIFIPEVITTPDHLPMKMDIDTEEEFFPKRPPSVKGELTIQEKSSVRPESWKVSAMW